MPRLRRGGKVVNSSWVGAVFVGERGWFLELSEWEAKKGEVQKENPETLTLSGIFGDLPRSALSLLLVSFESHFVMRESPQKASTRCSSRKINGGDLRQTIKRQLSHARKSACFFYHPSIGVMKSSPWKSESPFFPTNHQEHVMRWNLDFLVVALVQCINSNSLSLQWIPSSFMMFFFYKTMGSSLNVRGTHGKLYAIFNLPWDVTMWWIFSAFGGGVATAQQVCWFHPNTQLLQLGKVPNILVPDSDAFLKADLEKKHVQN